MNTYTINIDKCIENTGTPAFIRMAFMQLRDNGYLPVGEFFASLSDVDLDTLVGLAHQVESEIALEHLGMLTLALMVGEGREVTEDSMAENISLTAGFAIIESIYRKGLVDVHRDKWTMDINCPDKVVELKSGEQ